MTMRLGLLLAAMLAVSTIPAQGRDRRPLRESRSENDRYRLRIEAGRGKSHRCRAILYERVAENQRDRRIWRERFVNEVAPRRAFISNDGRFVITLDEFRRGGAAHAVVIYGERGRLLREFGLRELLHGDDWKHATVEQKAIEWLPEAAFAFIDSPPQFAIRLAWGREIRIDLETQKILTRRNGVATTQPRISEADNAIPLEILALLTGPTSAPSERPDVASASSEQSVRQALLELHCLATLAGVEVDGLDSAATTVAAAIIRDAPGTIPSETAAGQPTTAGNSATTDVPVPAADPANPADYVAWMKAQSLTDGPSAVPYYQAAMDNAVEWEGDHELFRAAIDGDPNALASPQITEWLAANQDALDYFRTATDFDFRGMPLETTDGTVIGFLLPHLSKTRLLARAAVIEAHQLEADGQTNAAMDRYLDVLAAGAQVGQGPTLIGSLVGISMQTLASEQALDCFARLTDDEVDYVNLSEAMVDSYRPVRPIEETFQFERVMILDTIQRVYEWNPETSCYRASEEGLRRFASMIGTDGGFPDEIAFGFTLGIIGFDAMNTQVNEHFDALTDAARMPYQQGRQAFRDAEAPLRDPSFRFRNPLLSVLMPSLCRATHLTTRSASSRRATLLVTHLKAYRQQYGAYPDSLDVFGDAEMVIDPFTDYSFTYRRDGDDFVLYSLGGNGVDDGGVHDRRGDTNDVLYWPRPPRDD